MQAMQLDLFAAPPPPGPLPHVPDPLVDRLVSSDMAANHYLLTINRTINCPAMDLPSRLFQWPVEFVDRSRRDDGKSALLLNHPDLADLPFVDEIERRSGQRPVWEAEDEYGRDRGQRYRWGHALDLLTDEHWQDLLRTRNFTDRDGIVCGLSYHATYGGLSTANMRSVLAEIAEVEPGDKSAAYLASDDCLVTEALQGKFVGFRHDKGGTAHIWATIHGLEAKKFKRDGSGYLRFAPAFLAEKTA
jgi:hypothetical protein